MTATAASSVKSTMQKPDEIQQTDREAQAEAEPEMAATPPAGDARGRTWTHGMPPMRMQRLRWRVSGRPAPGAEPQAGVAADGEESGSTTGFPPTIRLVRAVIGIILLALAWGGALVIYLLAMMVLAPLTRHRLVTLLPLRVAEGLGACLLVVVVATLLIVGAFALSLAVHPNDPPFGPPEASSAAGTHDQP